MKTKAAGRKTHTHLGMVQKIALAQFRLAFPDVTADAVGTIAGVSGGTVRNITKQVLGTTKIREVLE